MSLKGFFLIILIPFMAGIMSIFGGAQGTSVVLLNNQKGKVLFFIFSTFSNVILTSLF